ncbi:MAG: hypothetical protein LC777_14965 [Actinobacteria bacterium]|nr:hypothetical protein [Actinomycetota bacterium]
MGRGEPDWQPISLLATIASLSEEGLRDAREHYATLLEARPRPHVLDDATIARTSNQAYSMWVALRHGGGPAFYG